MHYIHIHIYVCVWLRVSDEWVMKESLRVTNGSRLRSLWVTNESRISHEWGIIHELATNALSDGFPVIYTICTLYACYMELHRSFGSFEVQCLFCRSAVQKLGSFGKEPWKKRALSERDRAKIWGLSAVATSCVWYDAVMCVIWLIHMCDMTGSYVWHDPFTCVTGRTHMCVVTHSYGWHDLFRCVTALIHMCGITHSTFQKSCKLLLCRNPCKHTFNTLLRATTQTHTAAYFANSFSFYVSKKWQAIAMQEILQTHLNTLQHTATQTSTHRNTDSTHRNTETHGNTLCEQFLMLRLQKMAGYCYAGNCSQISSVSGVCVWCKLLQLWRVAVCFCVALFSYGL